MVRCNGYVEKNIWATNSDVLQQNIIVYLLSLSQPKLAAENWDFSWPEYAMKVQSIGRQLELWPEDLISSPRKKSTYLMTVQFLVFRFMVFLILARTTS